MIIDDMRETIRGLPDDLEIVVMAVGWTLHLRPDVGISTLPNGSTALVLYANDPDFDTA